MKAVVVGGSGFVGSHVADALSARGHEVVLFDVKPSPYAAPTQRMVLGDLLDRAAIEQVLQGCDVAYHFAGLADLDDATTKAVETVQQNILGTTVLLDAAVQAGITRVIYASTIYVYGRLGGFYRCSKQAAELYIEEYQRRYGLAYTVLRYGSLYGPRANAYNAVWSYLQQGLLEGTIVYPGTGEEAREYVHVRDAAKLSVDILAEEFANQHVIITGHHRMKAAEMLQMIREILNHRVTIEYAGADADDAHYTAIPYSFIPKVGNKLVSHCYVDMGQGLLECLHEMAAAHDPPAAAASLGADGLNEPRGARPQRVRAQA